MNLKEELERLFQTGDSSTEKHSAVPMLNSKGVPIETLIDIVQCGGEVQTGIDIFNKNGVLLLEKSARIRTPKPLLIIRQNGIFEVPVSPKHQGGLWDQTGRSIPLMEEEAPKETLYIPPEEITPVTLPSLQTRLHEIDEIKAEAGRQHLLAKKSMRQIISQLKESGGRFDVSQAKKTVEDLSDFISEEQNAFTYLAREIFKSEEFLFNHAVNVCAISTAVLNHFNTHFSQSISNHLQQLVPVADNENHGIPGSFLYYSPEDILDITMGFFLHDIGKTAIPENVLNKPSPLTMKELEISKSHSYRKGVELLNKNGISNPFIRNVVKYHHAPLYVKESGGYPRDKAPHEIPAYVKICKIIDIYDAMTSRRFHMEAANPIRVVTSIIRTYAHKDPMLQFILHAFIDAVGIRPPGSIVYLTNRQMAYIVDSNGPIVLPFTNDLGQPLKAADYIDFGNLPEKDSGLAVDSRDPVITPKEAYNLLPPHLRQSLFGKNGPGL